jgi:hypothetical protein
MNLKMPNHNPIVNAAQKRVQEEEEQVTGGRRSNRLLGNGRVLIPTGLTRGGELNYALASLPSSLMRDSNL